MQIAVSSTVDAQLASCLAYQVLNHPDNWIGGPSTVHLQAFLAGTELRAVSVQADIPWWTITGVLDDPAFYQQFVDATGHPTLSIRWATALAMTHFSFADGFAVLKDRALDWHRANGPIVAVSANPNSSPFTPDTLWSLIAQRPAMYMGDSSGWTLYCFLNGMDSGGDWLNLPSMPRLKDIFGAIKDRSHAAYGSPFAAFRVYNAHDLLGWVGLPSCNV